MTQPNPHGTLCKQLGTDCCPSLLLLLPRTRLKLAGTKAKTYLPNKPDKYGLRFFAIAGLNTAIWQRIADNFSGNTLAKSAAPDYCKLFGTF